MTGSPIETAAWTYEVIYLAAPGYSWTAEQIITWTMMYHIQGPYDGMVMYKEATTVR